VLLRLQGTKAISHSVPEPLEDLLRCPELTRTSLGSSTIDAFDVPWTEWSRFILQVHQEHCRLVVVHLIDEPVKPFLGRHEHMITHGVTRYSSALRSCAAARRTYRGAVPPGMSRAARAESTVMPRTSRPNSGLAEA